MTTPTDGLRLDLDALAELTGAEYEEIQRAAIDAYEAATPADYRYSATALRKAVDAAIVVYRRAVVPSEKTEPVKVSVKEMKLSDGRSDFYVSVACSDRELTPYMSRIKGRAEWTAAEFEWLLHGGEKPNMLDWLDRTRDPNALDQGEAK